MPIHRPLAVRRLSLGVNACKPMSVVNSSFLLLLTILCHSKQGRKASPCLCAHTKHSLHVAHNHVHEHDAGDDGDGGKDDQDHRHHDHHDRLRVALGDRGPRGASVHALVWRGARLVGVTCYGGLLVRAGWLSLLCTRPHRCNIDLWATDDKQQKHGVENTKQHVDEHVNLHFRVQTFHRPAMAGENIATSPHAAHDAAVAAVPTAFPGVVMGVPVRGSVAHAIAKFVSLRNAAESLTRVLSKILKHNRTSRCRVH